MRRRIPFETAEDVEYLSKQLKQSSHSSHRKPSPNAALASFLFLLSRSSHVIPRVVCSARGVRASSIKLYEAVCFRGGMSQCEPEHAFFVWHSLTVQSNNKPDAYLSLCQIFVSQKRDKRTSSEKGRDVIAKRAGM